MKVFGCALAALVLFGQPPVSGQSLAELAKKEKERREKLAQQKVKSYTELDLGRGGTFTSGLVGPATSPPASPAAEPGPGEGEQATEDPSRTESYWRERLAGVDRRIADLEEQLNRPGFREDPSNMMRRLRIENDLGKARAERESILDEARRKGVPPGWVR